MRSPILHQIICGLLILLWVYTGTSKFLNFNRFYFEINNQPFPNFLTPFLVWLIPSLELLLAALLFIPRSRKAGLIGSLILMALFTVYAGLVLAHVFPYVPCSCGGVIKSLSWPQHLVFNLFFVVITLIAIRADPLPKPQQETPSGYLFN